MTERELWTVRQIADEYGLSPASVRSYIKRHHLKHVDTVGSRDARRYDATEVRRLRSAQDKTAKEEVPDA